MTHQDAAPASSRTRRGAVGGGVIAVVATINAYVNDGWGPAVATALVCVVAVAFVLAVSRAAGR